MFDEHNELKNRYLHIDFKEKPNIGYMTLTQKTKEHVIKLYEVLNSKEYFGRTEVINILGISVSTASEIIKNCLITSYYYN